jgi:RES domain-containing protein
LRIELWRLYRSAHGPGLDGAGGLYAAGRWHDIGSRVVYFGSRPAIVALEKLAHIDPPLLPVDLVLARFEGNLRVLDQADFDRKQLGEVNTTRASGELFLKNLAACVLRVPSILMPEESNLVFNPLHADAAKVELTYNRPFTFNSRLV